MTRQTISTTVREAVPGALALLLLLSGSASAVAAAAKKTTASGNTQFVVLNTVPLATYTVLKNQSSIAVPTSSRAGAIAVTDVTAPGDIITFRFDAAADPFPPSQLTGFAATGQNTGCARLEWDTPPTGEYVQQYRIEWGTTSGVYPNSTIVDRLQVAGSGATTYYSPCGFPEGTYYFVISAVNVFDLWSPRSAETSATITNGNTQGPPIPQGVSVTAPPFTGCATVSWNAAGDVDVVGYRVYWRTSAASAYTDSADTDATSHQICGLAAGTHYFSVRSRTAGGLLSGYSIAVNATIQVDQEGPVVYGEMPGDGEIDVPRNAGIFFIVTDPGTGVDISTLSVTVAGAAPASVAVLGNASGYMVQASTGTELPADASVSVTVRISDLASPPNPTTHTWQFTTGGSSVFDTDPPVLSAVSPVAGEENVKPDAPVVVRVTDAGLGVDIGSLTMFVNDVPVAFVLEGTPQSLTVRYQEPGGFPRGSNVTVRVEACDRSPTVNCAAPNVYAFQIEEDFYAGMPDGAIVPDGFWAGDPARPLEVRNLPMQWSVRIFDAAGSQVKRFRNNVSDGFVWLWDFTNDHNQRVVRSLYLIRVIDAKGNVRQTGRFLVQSDS